MEFYNLLFECILHYEFNIFKNQTTKKLWSFIADEIEYSFVYYDILSIREVIIEDNCLSFLMSVNDRRKPDTWNEINDPLAIFSFNFKEEIISIEAT